MEPLIGEIRMFAGTFAPAGWAFCQGQLLAIAEYDTLFSLLGTTYGGDGVTNFALPNLSGRVPIHQGQRAGFSNRLLAEQGGVEEVVITTNQMPAHSHGLIGAHRPASTRAAPGAYFAEPGRDLYASSGTSATMATAAVSQVGSAQAHTNLMPYVVVNYIISLFGIYPSQS